MTSNYMVLDADKFWLSPTLDCPFRAKLNASHLFDRRDTALAFAATFESGAHVIAVDAAKPFANIGTC